MVYLITQRLAVDEEIEFVADIGRCVELVNRHQSVAVGTFEEASSVLLGLGFTEGSVRSLMGSAIAFNDMESVSLLPSDREQYALPR